jgi:hypothetical protein
MGKGLNDGDISILCVKTCVCIYIMIYIYLSLYIYRDIMGTSTSHRTIAISTHVREGFMVIHLDSLWSFAKPWPIEIQNGDFPCFFFVCLPEGS